MSEPAVVSCPACWEEIELEVDPDAGDAVYAEDCPVCCRPMKVTVRIDAEGDFSVEVEAES